MSYQVVASTTEFVETDQLHVNLDGEDILICRHNDQYYAVSYYCSHEEFTLEGGTIANHCITCPYHGAEFDLRTGEALTAPAWETIKTWDVRVEDDLVSISPATD